MSDETLIEMAAARLPPHYGRKLRELFERLTAAAQCASMKSESATDTSDFGADGESRRPRFLLAELEERSIMQSHRGAGWRLIFAANGNTQHEELGDRYTASEFVEHWKTNPPVLDGPLDGIPSKSAQGANDNLEREGERHWGDLTAEEVGQLTGQPLAVALAVAKLGDLGLEVGFCLHRLNSLRRTATGLDARDPDPYGIVVYFPGIPALDRNAKNSPRESVQFAESITEFLDNPTRVAQRAEQSAIEQGLVIDPVFPHSGPIMAKLEANRQRRPAAPAPAPPAGIPPVQIG